MRTMHLSPADEVWVLYFSSPHLMSYVVASKVKELLKGMGMMTAGDFPDALSKEVEGLIKKGAARAKANDRVTVGPRDL